MKRSEMSDRERRESDAFWTGIIVFAVCGLLGTGAYYLVQFIKWVVG